MWDAFVVRPEGPSRLGFFCFGMRVEILENKSRVSKEN